MSHISCLFLATLLLSRAAAGQEQQAPPAGGMREQTQRQFYAYVVAAEERIDNLFQRPASFLWADSEEKRSWLRKTKTGVFTEARAANYKIANGLIHDWVGSAFIPGATVADVLALLQDYDSHSRIYAPDVIESKTLKRSGDDFKVRMRLFKKKVTITAVLDTYSDVQYKRLTGNDWESRSRTTRIVEIADLGRPKQRELPPEQEHGYLWQLNSYWLFRERDGGVYVECQAISVSRSLPPVPLVAPAIESIISDLSEGALRNTLETTRKHVLNRLASPRRP